MYRHYMQTYKVAIDISKLRRYLLFRPKMFPSEVAPIPKADIMDTPKILTYLCLLFSDILSIDKFYIICVEKSWFMNNSSKMKYVSKKLH